METSPLLGDPASSHRRQQQRSAWHEFLDLSAMAAQVSLATLARAALTSIDSVFLGRLGVKELAAASLAQLWTSPVLLAVWASASALNTLCGQSWGAGNRELTGVWLQFGIVITTLLSLPVTIWYWCVGYVLEYSTDDQEVIALATQFARVLSGAILPSLLYCCLRQYFQALGVLLPTTAVGIISIFVAAGSNYILIYGVGSWQGLGFVGSPMATVIASWFQPIALFSYGFLLKRHHHRAWNGWDRHAFTLTRLRSFVKVAGPIASNSFVSNLANALVALVAASLGARIIAANAVISGLWGLLWALFWGYGCATQVRVANYLGAGKPHLARRVTALGFACTGVVVALLAVATSLLDQRIIAIYTTDPELLAICRRVLPVFIAAYVFESGEVLCAGVLTGMSQVKTVFWTSAMATWLINLPVAYIGGLTLGFGFPALWVGVLSMEIFKVSSYVLALSRVRWDDAAARVMLEMEATPTTEQGAVGFITAVVDSQPTGCLATMSEATTPPLTTSPFDRRRRMRKENCNFSPLAETGVVKPFSPNNSQSQKRREM